MIPPMYVLFYKLDNTEAQGDILVQIYVLNDMVRETKLDPLYMSQSTGSSLSVEHKPLKPSGTAQQHYVILGNWLKLSFFRKLRIYQL